MTNAEHIVLRNLLSRAVPRCGDDNCDEPATHEAGFDVRVPSEANDSPIRYRCMCERHALEWSLRSGGRSMRRMDWQADAIEAASKIAYATGAEIEDQANDRARMRADRDRALDRAAVVAELAALNAWINSPQLPIGSEDVTDREARSYAATRRCNEIVDALTKVPT